MSLMLLWSNLRSRFEGSRARTPSPESRLAVKRIASMSFDGRKNVQGAKRRRQSPEGDFIPAEREIF